MFTSPEFSDVLNGKISKFSIDALVNMLAPVGLTFDVRPIERPPVRAVTKVKGVPADRSTRATSSKRNALSTH